MIDEYFSSFLLEANTVAKSIIVWNGFKCYTEWNSLITLILQWSTNRENSNLISHNYANEVKSEEKEGNQFSLTNKMHSNDALKWTNKFPLHIYEMIVSRWTIVYANIHLIEPEKDDTSNQDQET